MNGFQSRCPRCGDTLAIDAPPDRVRLLLSLHQCKTPKPGAEEEQSQRKKAIPPFFAHK